MAGRIDGVKEARIAKFLALAHESAMRLDVHDLSCTRAGRAVFAGISFSLGAGEAMIVRGANGAGKSSLLRILAGLDEAEAGDILVDGKSAGEALPQMTHYLAHADAVKHPLTVEEHLDFFASLLGKVEGSFTTAAAIEAYDLSTLRLTPARYLSAGQKRRLALARLLVSRRPLWLLDEPTGVLDQASTARFEENLAAHCRHGGMAIAVTHDPLTMPGARTLRLGAS